MRLFGLAVCLAVAGSWSPAAAQEAPPAPVTRWYVVLAKDQRCTPPDGYRAFVKANAGTKRSALRTAGLNDLHDRATAAQPTLLAALGTPKEVRSLWVVNALVAKLSDAQAETARTLDTVCGVFPAGPVPAGTGSGTLQSVINPPRTRPAFSPEGKQVPWNLQGLHVPEAWTAEHVDGTGVVVAMLDAGTNYTAQDLTQNIWVNRQEVPNNGRDDDGNGLVDDWVGWDFVRHGPEVMPGRQHHGTFTASVVAGDGTGGTVTGVAPRARLMLLRAWGGFYVAARAFQYALENGADVISMSFSIPGLGQTRGLWRLMCEHASACGLASVSGAGNFQQQQPIPVQIRIPEGIPCVICAGGVNRDLSLPRYVSLGPVEWAGVKLYGDYPMPNGLVKPDVCAYPGPGIGLVAPGASGYLPPDNRKRGNSLSAPHVAGACALMLHANPELMPWQLQQILQDTAADIPPAGKDPKTGAGLMNVVKAVRAAKKLK